MIGKLNQYFKVQTAPANVAQRAESSSTLSSNTIRQIGSYLKAELEAEAAADAEAEADAENEAEFDWGKIKNFVKSKIAPATNKLKKFVSSKAETECEDEDDDDFEVLAECEHHEAVDGVEHVHKKKETSEDDGQVHEHKHKHEEVVLCETAHHDHADKDESVPHVHHEKKTPVVVVESADSLELKAQIQDLLKQSAIQVAAIDSKAQISTASKRLLDITE